MVELSDSARKLIREWEEEFRCCYIGYTLAEIHKKEEMLDFDEQAIEESRAYLD